jgi:cytochrome b561
MTRHYSSTAKSLHWLMALLFFGMLALGFYMTGLSLSPQKLQLYSWHKWAGITVFLLALFRLAWRISHTPPDLPDTMSRAAKWLAHSGHWVLYLLMLAIPLSGWLMSSAKGFQTVWFGIVPIPDLLSRDRELGNLLAEVHGLLNWAFIALLSGHILAALMHQFINKDRLLERMLPARFFSK